MALTPICFQLFRCEDDHRFWMDYVGGTVTVSEVSDALASDWIPGSAVYVGERRQPLSEDQRIAVQPGCLITIVAPGGAFPVLRLLDAMLSLPEGGFRDLDRLGFPPDVFLPFQYCLLQPLHGPVFVPFLYMGPSADFDAVMCSHASAGWGSVALHRPRLEVLDLRVRQRSVGALFAAFPSQPCTRAAVFIDARHICRPVQVYASFTGTMHISEFLRSVGLEVPDPLDIIVTGTARYQQFSGAITVAEDDQIGLSFGARRMMAQPVDICHDGVGVGGEDGPRPEGDGGGPPVRERSPRPRRVYPAGPMRPSALVGPRAAVVTAGVSAASLGFDVARQEKAVAGLCDRLLLADPTFAAVRFHSLQELRARLRRCALPRGDWVFQEEVPHPHHQDTGQPDAQQSPSAEATVSPSSSPTDAADSLPELLCIRVVVLHFQCERTWTQLWYERGEAVESLMIRARILLNSDPAFFTLECVNPQLSGPQLTLLGFPTWWLEAGLRPCVVHSCSLPASDFVQVISPGQLASDFVVDAALPVGGRCVAYAPSDGAREAIPIDPDEPLPVAILPAAVVCVQPEHDPVVALPTAFEHLQTLQHTLAAAGSPDSGSSTASSLALFLGFGFDHFLVDLAPGSVLQRLSEALQLPRSDIFILRQWPTFESLEVAGRRPRTCFGFRNVRDLGRPFDGIGVFIDARAAGKPVSFRELRSGRLTPALLCTLLGVDPPAGFVPVCAGGEPTGGPCAEFAVAHGHTILLWLAAEGPGRWRSRVVQGSVVALVEAIPMLMRMAGQAGAL